MAGLNQRVIAIATPSNLQIRLCPPFASAYRTLAVDDTS